MTENGERKYIYGALVLIVESVEDLGTVRTLIDDGRQVLALISARADQAEHDILSEQLIGLADEACATLTAIQVGSARPKGWRRWLARLDETRAFLLTPKSLGDPSLAVFWAREAETGIKRLVVGEIKTFNVEFRED